MDDEAEGGATSSGAAPAPPGGRPGRAGWYPDPWSSTRQRWWTGESWSFSTREAAPEPLAPAPAPGAPSPPTPPAPQSQPAEQPQPGPAPARSRSVVARHPIAVLAVLGLVVGLVGGMLLRSPSKPSPAGDDAAAGQGPGTASPPTTAAPSANTDPSTAALSSLIVKQADVPSSFKVTLLAGGNGLSRPTLDLCNGTFRSESRRTARLQDGVFDGQGDLVLSTEAVLYADAAGASQGFSELKSVAAACPPAPVLSPAGQDPLVTRFGSAPDGGWPDTPTVTRLAFDFTSTTLDGRSFHSIAVYLERGRALLGVYFSEPDGPQPPVTGVTTIPEIVAVFAGRMAALPTSVVGS